MGTRFTLTGRLVQGDPCNLGPVQKDDRTGQIKMTKAGEPLRQFFCAIAIPKAPAQRHIISGNPTFEDVKVALDQEARSAWPQFFGNRPMGPTYSASLPLDCTNPKFANKIVDGDGFDDKGQPNNVKDGWAGCWVVKCVTMFAPKVYEWTASGWQEIFHTGRKIKCGDYITVSGDCSSNESAQTPGMYMNMDTVSFEAEGVAIVGANNVDPNAALGQRGAPASPPAQSSAPPAAAPAASAGQPAHGTAPSPTAAPYSDYRTVPAAPAAPPPPPAGPVMLPAANGIPYASYIQQGWTDDQLRASGYMA
jgi:hypothetical protein